MTRRAMTIIAFWAALSAAAVDELRPSALEVMSWNETVPPSERGDSVFSPVGFGVTVAMLGEGMGGSARAEMAESLGLLSDFSLAFANVLKSYAAANVSNRVAISIASSLWTKRRRALDPEYVRSLQNSFDAEAGFLKDVLSVNAWTEAKTDGRILGVMPELPHHAETIVVNAVAFEGAWKTPFEDENGANATFSRADGTKSSIRFMNTTCPMVRIDGERYSAAKIDFSARGVSFVVVMPAEGVDLAAIREKDFANGGIDDFKALLRARSGEGVTYARARFSIPAFSIRSNWRLDNALRKAKVPKGGFDRMGPEPFSIDEVHQAVYFRISGRGYSLTPGMEPDPVQPLRGSRRGELGQLSPGAGDEELGRKTGAPFVCNRPFLFFVWDGTSDTIVIAGQFSGR